MTTKNLASPYYIVYEERLRSNLSLINEVSRRSGAEIIMAFKANALWRTFNIVAEYCRNCTASSLNELRLGREFLGGEIHSYSPAYTDNNIDEFIAGSTHITFNSLSQLSRYGERAKSAGVSVGLRVNPKCSVVDTDLYNPALPGSRLGVDVELIGDKLPSCVDGLHFHCLCESSPDDLAAVLEAFEMRFGKYLPSLKWVNMGGGHLMTRADYNTDRLVEILCDFRKRWPNLKVILEPGSAFTWQTGDLIASVVDVVEDGGIPTAILNVSFACHMPDTLEMPYLPAVTESTSEELSDGKAWRLGGNSCLSGDYKGDYYFKTPLKIGDTITLRDMNHYTMVKTNMFNGIQHPDVVLQHSDGSLEILRQYNYDDYKSRMC